MLFAWRSRSRKTHPRGSNIVSDGEQRHRRSLGLSQRGVTGIDTERLERSSRAGDVTPSKPRLRESSAT